MKPTIIFLSAIIAFTSLPAQETKKFSVYFSTASYAPDAAALKMLDSVVQYCNKEKASIASISGYCDSVGTTDRNKILSEKRADAVKTVLMQKKVSVNNIQKKGEGESLEFSGNQFYKNRRVDIIANKPKEIKEESNKTNSLNDQFEKASVGDKIRLENITFYGGTPVPMPISEPVMQELYQVMADNPALEISIEGHICCSSSDEEDLSGQRAKAIYDFLLRKGIAAERMTYKGFGHTQPLTQERSEVEMQMNRRVEIRIVKN